MFYAVTKEGTRVPAEEFQTVNGNQECFCPGCQEKVFLKRGQLKVPHFAHYQQAGCSTFSEGETRRHLIGKQVLLRWLNNQNIEAQLEPWLPLLHQRPDLLVSEHGGQQIALEYQCSPISLQRLKERSEGYKKEGYGVIWLLGMEYKVGERIWDKQVEFMQWSPQMGFHLTCLDSLKEELYVYQHIHYDQRNVLRCSLEKVHIHEISWERFLKVMAGKEVCLPFPAYNQLTVAENLTKRMALLRRHDDQHRFFLERLYLNRHALGDLSEILFRQPTKTLLYATPTYIWKYDFLCWLQEVGGVVQEEDISQYYHQALQARRLVVRASLDLEACLYLQPLLDFLAVLVNEGKAALVGVNGWYLLSPFL